MKLFTADSLTIGKCPRGSRLESLIISFKITGQSANIAAEPHQGERIPSLLDKVLSPSHSEWLGSQGFPASAVRAELAPLLFGTLDKSLLDFEQALDQHSKGKTSTVYVCRQF